MAAASRVVIRASSVISAWLHPSRASLITELRARSIFLMVFLPAAVTLSSALAAVGLGGFAVDEPERLVGG